MADDAARCALCDNAPSLPQPKILGPIAACVPQSLLVLARGVLQPHRDLHDAAS